VHVRGLASYKEVVWGVHVRITYLQYSGSTVLLQEMYSAKPDSLRIRVFSSEYSKKPAGASTGDVLALHFALPPSCPV